MKFFSLHRRWVSLICYGLCFQLIAGPVSKTWADDEDDRVTVATQEYDAPTRNRPSALPEQWLVFPDGTKASLREIDLQRPEFKFSATDQLRFRLEKNGTELWIDRMAGDKVSVSHVIDGPPFLSQIFDGENLYLTSEFGVHLIPISELKDQLFGQYVPVLISTTAPEKGTVLKDLAIANRNTLADWAKKNTTLPNEEPLQVQTGDLIVTVEQPNGTTALRPISRSMLLGNAAQNWIQLVLQAMIVAPDPQHAEELAEALESWPTAGAQLAAEDPDLKETGNTLYREALTSFAQRSGLLNSVIGAQNTSSNPYGFSKRPRGQWSDLGGANSLRERAKNKRESLEISNAAVEEMRKVVAEFEEQKSRTPMPLRYLNVSWGDYFRAWKGYLKDRKRPVANTLDDYYVQKRAQEAERYQPAGFESQRTRPFANGLVRVWNKIVNKKNLAVALGAVGIGATIGAAVPGTPILSDMSAGLLNVGIALQNSILDSTWVPAMFKDSITGLQEYGQNGGSWPAWFGGTAFFSLTLFMVYIAAFAIYSVKIGRTDVGDQGRFQESQRVFFQTMMRGYFKLNRVMELILMPFRQKNLYPAVSRGVPVSTPGVLNSPLASDKTLDENSKKIAEYLADETTLQRIAQRFAAVLLVSETKGIDPATLIQQENAGNRSIVQVLAAGDPEVHQQWALLSGKICLAAKDLILQKNILANVEELGSDVAFYRQIANRIREDATSETARNLLAQRLEQNRKLGSQKTLRWALGLDAKNLDATLGDRPLSVDAQANAASQANMDYVFSQLTFSAVAPDRFAWPGEPFIWSASTEQLISWPSVGSADSAASEAAQASVGDSLLGDQFFGQSSQFRAKRPITFFGSIAAVLKGAFDPRPAHEKGHKSFLETLDQYIVNMGNGAFARTLMLSVPLLAMTFSQIPWMSFGEKIWGAVTTTWYIMFSKYTVRPVGEDLVSPGVASFILGYALVWPFLTGASYMIKAELRKNRNATAKTVNQIDSGIQKKDLKLMREGVKALKGLYHRGNIELPVDLNISSKEYDFALADNLISFSKLRPPLPTDINEPYDIISNLVVGAILSSILYNDVTGPLVERGGSNLLELGVYAFTGLIATRFILKNVNRYVTQPLAKVAQKPLARVGHAWTGFKRACGQALLGKAPVNVE